MASSGKKKTTMAKLARESRLRERRQQKQAKKEARKLASAEGTSEALSATEEESARTDAGEHALDPVIQPLADA